MDRDLMERYLYDLNEELGRTGKSAVLVVCGAHAMRVQKLTNRLTYDVDVLGTLEYGEIVDMKFEPWFQQAIKRVSDAREIPRDWLNLGGKTELMWGLPEGAKSRLVRRSYGKNLTVYYLSRIDLICCKFNAGLDMGAKHDDDILRMKPSEEEMHLFLYREREKRSYARKSFNVLEGAWIR